MSTPSPAKKTRCAIYTRKSSDDGLDQAFNSLDAQRQSGESYISSHAGEGWVCLPTRYDDGGYTGGNMDRPGLRALLTDIAAGRVDVVVCYKLDRFTRSIRDFGRMMEELDRKGVALVMVTQPINTGTSMGRLMVHVLMSFAQFERELTSERTRDKIKLSRQRGQWTGGRPVLGYDFAGCKLLLNEREAPLVREIYGKYLEVRSLRGVLEHLASRGVTNKTWVTRDGRAMGGKPFVLSGIAQTLANPLYIGKVPHVAGQHPGPAREQVTQQHWANLDPDQLLHRMSHRLHQATDDVVAALMQHQLHQRLARRGIDHPERIDSRDTVVQLHAVAQPAAQIARDRSGHLRQVGLADPVGRM